MIFLVALLIGGIGVLAGGQLCALTGSIAAAILTGLGTVLCLGWAYRRATRSQVRRHLLGEFDSVVDESNFTERVREENPIKGRVQKSASDESARVAKTVRSLLRSDTKARGRR